MNREGTLHIVRLSRGAVPAYSVGFADYATSGGAMQTVNLTGDTELRNLFLKIGINERIAQSTFDGLATAGQASVLHVILPDHMLRELGLQPTPRNAKEKVEMAIGTLKRQGHTVQAVIREDGTMWFEIDRRMLASWEEMINLADGVYSLESLIELYKRRQALEKQSFAVRFTIFFEPGGPVLAYSLAGPFVPATFTSQGGAKYHDTGSLIRALDEIGLPGVEIVSSRVSTRTFTVTGAQLVQLGLKLPG